MAQTIEWRTSKAISTTINVALSSIVVVPQNLNRRCLYLWNNSANSAYIAFGSQTNSATPSAIVPTFTSFVMSGTPIYTGPIAAIRNAGTGTMTAWECMP